jgi:hypothetical protein
MRKESIKGVFRDVVDKGMLELASHPAASFSLRTGFLAYRPIFLETVVCLDIPCSFLDISS